MTGLHQEGAGLEVRALTRRFGGVLALDDVDLCVPAGTVHGLIGPNGAGKTTMLAVLLGLVRADSGDLRLAGRPLAQAGRAVPGGMAGTVEQPRFYGYLTARRNLEVVAGLDAPGGLDPAAALDAVALGDEADTAVAKLSMGMRQRLAIAAALLRRPRLLVLDEPTTGLDPRGAASLLQLVRSLAADGRSVLLSSHDLVMVAEICDDVTILVRGRVARSGSVAALVGEAPPPTYRLRTSGDATAQAIVADVPGAAVSSLVASGLSLRELGGHRAPLRALYDDIVGGGTAA
ncbi:MAG: ABC transporter ATP-binding protein [Nocardioidaceae bacterium]